MHLCKESAFEVFRFQIPRVLLCPIRRLVWVAVITRFPLLASLPPLDHTIRSSLHPAALRSDSKAAKDKRMSAWSRAGSVCLASEKKRALVYKLLDSFLPRIKAVECKHAEPSWSFRHAEEFGLWFLCFHWRLNDRRRRERWRSGEWEVSDSLLRSLSSR